MLLRIILPLSTLIYVTLTFFFFNDTATTEIYTLSLHDALPISFSAPERLLSGPLTLASSGRLLHLQAQIRGELAKLLHHARGPANLDACLAIFAKPEMHRQVAARGIPHAIGHRARLRPARRFARHLRPHRGMIALLPFQPQLQPVLSWAPVPPQFNAFANRGHRGIKPAVPIKVGKHRPAMQPRRSKFLPNQIRNIGEFPCRVPENAIGLRVFRLEPAPGDEQVRPAIIVQIHQPAAPAAPRTTQG